jgi:hypothetical protein
MRSTASCVPRGSARPSWTARAGRALTTTGNLESFASAVRKAAKTLDIRVVAVWRVPDPGLGLCFTDALLMKASKFDDLHLPAGATYEPLAGVPKQGFAQEGTAQEKPSILLYDKGPLVVYARVGRGGHGRSRFNDGTDWEGEVQNVNVGWP